MKKFTLLIALLFVLVFNGAAFGWGSSIGDGSDFGQLQETAVFFNNSGILMVHGMAVVLDLDSTASSTAPVKIAPTAGTTLGAAVEVLLATDSSVLVVGCVKSSSENQTPVVVVTKGPIDALASDETDAISSGNSVGTADIGAIGTIGEGENLGIALEDGDGTDGSYLFIWVSPTGAQ